MGLTMHAMMSQDLDAMVSKKDESDKVADNLPGDPTNSQMFAFFSPLVGKDQAALFAEIGKKASSIEEARRQLPIFKRLESIVQAAHIRSFEKTLPTYRRNVGELEANKPDDAVDVALSDAGMGTQFGLAKDVPLYAVRKDLHVFFVAVVDGQVKLATITFPSK